MPKPSAMFVDQLYSYILSWDAPIDVLKSVNVGYKYVGTPRKIDILLHNCQNDKYMGIQCTVQVSGGTADEKLMFSIEDCRACPIPTIIAFGGDFIRSDIKSQLVSSGIGVELQIKTKDEDNEKRVTAITDPEFLFKQRCYIDLGLNWLPFATGINMDKQIADLKSNKS